MKATLRHIYLCRTANMSWRTCVVVKQIKSIHPSGGPKRRSPSGGQQRCPSLDPIDLKVRFNLLGAVTAVRSGFLGYSVFMFACFHDSAAEAGVRGWSARMGPGAIFPFRPAERQRFWDNWCCVSLSIEAAILISKYPDRSEIGQAILQLCCWSASQISERLENYINLPAPTFHGNLG